MPPKKSTTPKKPAAAPKKASTTSAKTIAAHPPFAQMITEAITSLKDRQGSSRQALKKYITENFKVNETLFTKAFNRYLQAGIEAGTFIVSRFPSALTLISMLIACSNRKDPPAPSS